MKAAWWLLLLAACGQQGIEADAAPPADAVPLFDAPWQDDGTPSRQACTNTLGNELTMQHGRLDGFLRAIVPPGNGGCNADQDHVHLQIEMNSKIYDVAVNVTDPQNVDFLALDHALVDGAWREGWHADQAALLDYPTVLGVRATDFTPTTKTDLVAALQSELATANHVSVFMTAYGVDGGDYVHRRGSGLDGAIVTTPLGPAHYLLFHFANQNF